MPVKVSESAGEVAVVDRFDGGIGWIAHPEEGMQRASHALVTSEGVWVVDPVDGDGVDALLAALGDVAGVAVLLDRHTRDAETLARRHDVSVHVPPWFDVSVDAPTEPLTEGPGDFDLLSLKDSAYWNEAGLWDSETLLIPESVGTAPFFLTNRERLGVHPMRRLFPPTELRRYDPERILVGHGEGIFEDAPEALTDAVSNARSRLPRLAVQTLRGMLQ